MSAWTRAELQQQIDDAKAIVDAITAAILALQDITVTAYTLDTGQGTQRVTRENVPTLINQRRSLQNEIASLNARMRGAGQVTVNPAW